MTTYAVLDVETTGLNPREGHRIIEIAVLGVDEQLRERFRFETLVSIDRPVSATEVHGLTCADLAGAPTFEQIAPRLGELMLGSVLVAHYPRFDLGFLDAELARLGAGLPRCRVLDTRDVARAAGVRGGLRLADCCAELGVSNDRPHAAMGDVETTAKILLAGVERGVELSRHHSTRRPSNAQAGWPAGKPEILVDARRTA
jgi:DNA polymerase-3 subunit epsilon